MYVCMYVPTHVGGLGGVCVRGDGRGGGGGANLIFRPFPLSYPNNVLRAPHFLTKCHMQTVQTQIRLLLQEQSDQGLHCLLFH